MSLNTPVFEVYRSQPYNYLQNQEEEVGYQPKPYKVLCIKARGSLKSTSNHQFENAGLASALITRVHINSRKV